MTLKNPMFYNNNSNNNANNGNSETMMSMMRNLQTPPFVSPMDQQPPQPQQASIIKNENGMYTIRNPAFTSFGGGAAPSVAAPTVAPSGYGNGMGPSSSFVTNSNYMPTTSSSSTSSSYANPSSYDYESEFNQHNAEIPKCNSVIGSEMKNVLQRRKEQEYMDWNQQGMRSQYSHFGGMNFNGNNPGDEFSQGPPRSSSRGSGCYPSYPSPTMANYDELRLQPGKMLNSEVSVIFYDTIMLVLIIILPQVTIHNVTESKFFQNQKAQAPIGTPRNMSSADALGTSSGGPKLFGDLLVQQTLVSRPHAPSDYNGNGKKSHR